MYLIVNSYCSVYFSTFVATLHIFSYLNRKYKPLHMQSLTFPSLWYSGQFSPFESPPPLFEKHNKSVEAKTR